ncbi:HRDC domain-containing protein [Escherichia coli]
MLPIAHKLMAETEQAGRLEWALNECQLMQQRRQEVTDPADAWRDITNAWQLRTRQLACLQLLADWRLRKARERDLAVNFVVREEHLWSVTLYAGQPRRAGQPGAFRQRNSFPRQNAD